MEDIFYKDPRLETLIISEVSDFDFTDENNISSLFSDDVKDTQIYNYILKLYREIEDLRLKLIDLSNSYAKYTEEIATSTSPIDIEKKVEIPLSEILDCSDEIKRKAEILNKLIIFARYLSIVKPAPVLEFLIKANPINLSEIQMYLKNL